VVATNQSGLGRGLFDTAALNAMHLKMNGLLARLGGRIEAVFFCPHTPDDHCDCRKPQPGLLLQIGERYGVDLAQVVVVGDSLRDMQAAAAAGCQRHLVCTGKAAGLSAEQAGQWCAQVPDVQVHADLAAFAEYLIEAERQQRAASGEGDSGFDRLH
jgi:D-glycero-D-manno-heptose 1,7-bisphosphate phosphatase